MIKKDIAKFVIEYPNCQQVKVEHQKSEGLAQDIDIPTWKWEDINMDFITGLLKIRRQFDSIRIFLDSMMKSTHFLSVRTSYSAEDYAMMYINKSIRFYGVPLSIILDCCTEFTSNF